MTHLKEKKLYLFMHTPFFFLVCFLLRFGAAMELPLSDETLAIIVPILVYWVYSGIYIVLGYADSYRLHTKEEEQTKNSVSKGEVARVVLLQQLVQAFVAFFVIKVHIDSSIFPLFYLSLT